MNDESNTSKWMKVILPMLLTICLGLGGALWSQSSTVTTLAATLHQRTQVIEDFKATDTHLQREVAGLKEDFGELKAEIRVLSSNQDRVLSLVDKLADTLDRLEITMSKFETKLEYNEKG